MINDAGVVAYMGTLADGTMEIHTSDDSIVLTTDASATIVPELALNNAGHLAFGGTLADGRRGVFRVSPTVVSIVALTGFASGEFRSFGSPSLNNRGDLVFSADVIGGSDVLLRTTGDQLVTVADAGGNTFASFPPRAAINDAGVILFPTFLRSEEFAVFKAEDTLTPLADATLFDAEFKVRPGSLNATGRTAFIGLGASGEQRVLTLDASDQLQTTVTTATGVYTSLSNGDNSPALNDAGMVAFWAASAGRERREFLQGPIPRRTPSSGPATRCSAPRSSRLNLGGLNNRGEITFRALLSSGRQIIGVATPPGL